MPQQTNNFVIPTEDGDLVLHITPGPCAHQEHWLDPLHLGFRDNLRCHVGFHSLVGLMCVLVQLGSKSQEFAWYGRTGLGTWAGTMFFVTCLVGSYATHPDSTPRSMRAWMYVYVVFCGFSAWSAGALLFMNAVYSNYEIMAEWQHGSLALLGAVEFFFCLIEMTLVLHRVCTSDAAPHGFDFHVVVSYATDRDVAAARQLDRSEVPPPSYEQLYRLTDLQLQAALAAAEATILQDERIVTVSSASSSSSIGSQLIAALDRPNDIPLSVMGRSSTQTLLQNENHVD